MFSIVNNVNFGAASTDDTKDYSYYIVKFTSNTYNIKDNVIIDGRKIAMSEQVQ